MTQVKMAQVIMAQKPTLMKMAHF